MGKLMHIGKEEGLKKGTDFASSQISASKSLKDRSPIKPEEPMLENKQAVKGRINRKVGKLKEEMLAFTKSLVQLPTESDANEPCKNYGEMVELIKRELQALPVEMAVLGEQGKPNLVARWDVGAEKTLHVNGHYDTVKAVSSWKRNPFGPTIENGTLYELGSNDMKAALAAMVYALRAVHELGLVPSCNIELSFTCDEEIGGKDGARYLVQNMAKKPDFAIVLDGRDTVLNNAHKGVLKQEITIRGKSSHASRPYKGKNAFLAACKLALELDRLKKELNGIKTACDVDEKREACPTIMVGGVADGGSGFNTVPDKFRFTVDRRLIPDEKAEDAEKRIMEIVDGFKRKTRCEVEVKSEIIQPSFVPKDAAICRALQAGVKEATGKELSFALLPGFMDMRYFVNDAKIPCVAYGVSGEHTHGADENVKISSILTVTKALIYTFLNEELGR